MNQCIFRGRLTAKPELRTTQNGKSVTSFSLAVRRDMPYADGAPTADFVDFVAWNKQAETITQYVDKGDELFITDSSCRPSEFTDKDGNKRRKVEFWVNRFEFGAKAGDGAKRGDVPTNSADYVQPKSQPKEQEQSAPAIIPGLNARPEKQAAPTTTYTLEELNDDSELPF